MDMKMLYRKNQNGFTIKELLFVISIMSILALVAIPKYVNVANQTKEAQCLKNQLSLSAAARMSYALNIDENILEKVTDLLLKI